MSVQQWEYLTTYLSALAKNEKEYLQRTRPNWQPPKHAVQSLEPTLDRIGANGWELVHMQPVMLGDKHDVLITDGSTSRSWGSDYFCVFKRPIVRDDGNSQGAE